jgi:hypothetical protein
LASLPTKFLEEIRPNCWPRRDFRGKTLWLCSAKAHARAQVPSPVRRLDRFGFVLQHTFHRAISRSAGERSKKSLVPIYVVRCAPEARPAQRNFGIVAGDAESSTEFLFFGSDASRAHLRLAGE